VLFRQHRSMEERVEVGQACMIKMALEMPALVDEMDDAERGNDAERFYHLNIEFHDRIVDYTENDRLRAICEGLVKELHLYRRRSLLQGGGLNVSNREHRRILDAGSVMGMAFDPGLVGAVLEEKKIRVLEHLAEIERKRGLVQGEAGSRR